MGLKSILAKPLAALVAANVRKWSMNPVATQEKVFRKLIDSARATQFGKEHQFDQIASYEEFKKRVPVRDYEGFRSYIETIKNENKIAVVYGYIIAFEARNLQGLHDCNDASPNLCEQGADFIRNNRQHIIDRYLMHSYQFAKYLDSTTSKVVFLTF